MFDFSSGLSAFASFSFDGSRIIGWFYVAIVSDDGDNSIHYYHISNKNNFSPDISVMQTKDGSPVIDESPGPESFLVKGKMKVRDIRYGWGDWSLNEINDIRVSDFENAVGRYNNGNYLPNSAYVYYAMNNIQQGGASPCTGCQSYKIVDSVTKPWESGHNPSYPAYLWVTSEYGSGWANVADRNGTAAHALQLPNTNHTFTDGFPIRNPEKGYTISFWTKLDAPITSIDNGIGSPFKASDPLLKAFFAHDGNIANEYIGLQMRRDRLSNSRISKKDNGAIVPWQYWLYDPVSFKGKAAGWYHITMVQDKYWAKIYLAAKSETIKCDCKDNDVECLNNCPGSYNYLSAPVFVPTGSSVFGLGGFGANNSMKYLDDFRIYNWPFDEREVGALHEIESGRLTYADGSSPKPSSDTDTPAEKPSISKIAGKDQFSLYPNPNSGRFTVGFNLTEPSVVNFRIADIQGRGIYQEDKNSPAGTQQYNLNVNNIPTGIYFLKINTNEFSRTEKINIVR